MPELRQYELARVRELTSSEIDRDGWRINRRSPRVGDVGTLIDILQASGLPDRYVVECPSTLGDGSTEWLSEFTADELEPVG